MPGTRRAATSFAQDGLWYLEQLAPGSPAPTVCRAWEVSGPLDIGALRAAWYEVVRRHEILRATLVTEGGQPVLQLSGHPARRSFTEIAGPVPDAAAAERLFAELGSVPMALAKEPLARLTVAGLAGHRHLVVMALHRGVADDRSAAILVSELSACYAAAASGQPPDSALRAPIAQYTDYTSWQREQVGTPRYQELRQWWTAALTPPPPPLALPADRSAPPEPSWRGGTVWFGWGEDVSRLLTHRCRDQATQPWVLLLTAFQSVLRRYSGQDRVPVGMPVTAPVPQELAGTVGPLDNIVVLCTDLGGRPTFREAAARVQRSAADALDHCELPFALLIRDLNLNRDPRLMPLCDAMFVAREGEEPELTLPGTAVIRRDGDSAAVHADLTLTMAGPTGSLSFRDSRFRNASALRVAEQIRTLFVAALRSPDQPVDTLDMDGQDRIRTTVRVADQISGAVPADLPVHELVHRQARRRPDAVAVAYAGTVLTYRELERHAAAVTRALTGAGAVAGQPVAVRTATGPWHAAALLGVLDAGAHVVCLSAGDVGARGRAILDGLRPAWLVVDGAAARSELASWYTGELGGQVLDVSQLLEGAPSPDALTDSAQAPHAPPGSRRMLGELAYVAFTSGSTGSPKGIPQLHETLSQFVTWFSGEFGIGQGSRVAQWAAPGYDASLCEVFATLTAGATLCPVPDKIRANPEKLATLLAAERITVLQTVPSFAKNLLKVIADRSAARQLTRLNHLLLAGEALPGELANELRATLPWTRLINLYGSTETILATWHEISGPVAGTVPIGRSIPGRQVMLLDSADRPCPSGVSGQIVVRTPYVTPGYLGEDAAGQAAFRPVNGLQELGRGNSVNEVGWYRTGDLGRLRWDGTLEFCGRQDKLVKFQGRRVELEDIEATLATHDSLSDCAVVPVAGADGLVRRLVAYVVPSGADEPAAGLAAQWRRSLRRAFGDSMLPVSFTTVASLPRNLGGKVDRRMLADQVPESASAPAMPRTPAQVRLAGLWAELTGAGCPGVDDNFFAAGGHSMLMLTFLDRIRANFGVELPLWECCVNPTIAGIAALVESAQSTRNSLREVIG